MMYSIPHFYGLNICVLSNSCAEVLIPNQMAFRGEIFEKYLFLDEGMRMMPP